MSIAIIVAGGKGERTGKNIPKAFLEISGKPLLFYSIEKFKDFSSLIIVLPKNHLKIWKDKLKLKYPDINMEIVPGGENRQTSVWNGIERIKGDEEIVLIHDVARPLLSKNLIKRVLTCAEKYGSCIPVIKSVDTLKKIKNKKVEKTLDRNEVFLVQTPQGFKTGIIKQAYEKAKKENFIGTDDSMLVERMGLPVYCIEGERTNLKITYGEDIVIAESILNVVLK